MKNKVINGLIVMAFAAGICLLLYPFVSNTLNVRSQSKAIHAYEAEIENMKNEEMEQAWAEADRYNQELRENYNRWSLTENEKERYDALLNLSGDGVMGYIEIPKIGCSLSIGHGTSEEVLETAIGHMEGSSLPVGGIGTHCALSGHRGLPSAKLFTDLDKLEEGDLFYVHVLGEKMTYKVNQIVVVEPDDMNELAIDPDRDYCTLVTCTPYGVNSHRLLVRGERKMEE